jgi:hypothetical protein
MQIYHLKNIYKNMLVNWKIYLVLFLELCLCFFLIFLGVNESSSHGKRAELLSHDQVNNICTVQYQDKEPAFSMQTCPHSPVMNSEELDKLESNQVIQRFYYSEITHLSYLSSSGNVESVDVAIANKDFFKHYLDVSDVKTETCYIIPQLLSTLKRDFQSAPFDDAQFSGEHITLNGKQFDFSEMPVETSPIVTSFYSEFDIDPKKTIFILKDKVNEVLSAGFEIYRVVMKYKTSEKELDCETREIFFEQLNGYANDEFSFSELHITQVFQKGGDSLNAFVRVFSWAGQVAFLIVVVGISGIFILIIQKRYKQLCICYINGLTKKDAFMQIFIEVLLLVSIPSIIGMILVINFQGNFNSIYYPIEWHPLTTVVFILLPIIITLVVTVISSSWLRNLNVVKWLKRIE